MAAAVAAAAHLKCQNQTSTSSGRAQHRPPQLSSRSSKGSVRSRQEQKRPRAARPSTGCASLSPFWRAAWRSAASRSWGWRRGCAPGAHGLGVARARLAARVACCLGVCGSTHRLCTKASAATLCPTTARAVSPPLGPQPHGVCVEEPPVAAVPLTRVRGVGLVLLGVLSCGWLCLQTADTNHGHVREAALPIVRTFHAGAPAPPPAVTSPRSWGTWPPGRVSPPRASCWCPHCCLSAWGGAASPASHRRCAGRGRAAAWVLKSAHAVRA